MEQVRGDCAGAWDPGAGRKSPGKTPQPRLQASHRAPHPGLSCASSPRTARGRGWGAQAWCSSWCWRRACGGGGVLGERGCTPATEPRRRGAGGSAIAGPAAQDPRAKAGKALGSAGVTALPDAGCRAGGEKRRGPPQVLGPKRRLGQRRPAPGSRVQGSAVFRLPSDLTPGPQRPPGCAAMAQPSSRCEINEPTSGWVYSSAKKQPSGK